MIAREALKRRTGQDQGRVVRLPADGKGGGLQMIDHIEAGCGDPGRGSKAADQLHDLAIARLIEPIRCPSIPGCRFSCKVREKVAIC